MAETDALRRFRPHAPAAVRARFQVTERTVETAREAVEFKVPRVLRERVA